MSGGRRTRYGGLDLFRVAAALLVVANHTGPLLSFNGTANYLITDILARLAVPFFFAVSGFFLVPKLTEQGRSALWPFMRKCLLLYGVSTLLYLPLMARNGYFGQPGLALNLLRDLVLNGTFYHLWYFPAAVLGSCIVAALLRAGKGTAALPVCAVLYVLGLLGDSYYGLTAALPPLKAVYEALFLGFDYTRNGLFFAPLFLLLGGLLARRPEPARPGRCAARLSAALALLIAEGLLVRGFSLARHDSMYLLLPLCVWLLVQWLRALKVKPLPALRTLSTVVYVVHPLCIVGVRGAGKALGLLAESGFLLGNSLVHYLAVAAASCLTALPFLFWRRRRPKPPAPPPDPQTGPRAWAEIDMAALKHNISALRQHLPRDCRLMAVVKANAYGHGDGLVCRACEAQGVDAFAVATADEGVRLRLDGVRGDILVLGWTDPAQAPLLSRHDLIQTVVSVDYACRLDAANVPLRVHLKLDTGMHRLGIPWDDADHIAGLYACQHLRIEGLFTHLAAAETLDEADEARTEEQIRRFYRGAEELQRRGLPTGKLHIQSSYGMLNYPGLPCDYARVGIALYGLLSSPGDRTRLTPDLRPVLSLRARVAELRDIAAGDTAGYDGAFTARRPSRVAVVSIGYGDGYPRALSGGRGVVLVRGQHAPVAGLICMDQMLVDVTDIPGVAEGDTVTLIGRDGSNEITAGQLARAADTITNELLCRLGPRVERIAV